MTAAMDLGTLLADPRAPGVEVTGVACDSRRVRRGDLFIACRGRVFDGHDFVPAAVAAGAAAVVSQRPVEARIANFVVPDIASRLGQLGERFYGSPSRELELVGVTGTNGKTTVAYNIAQVLDQDGFTGYIGTLGWGKPPRLRASTLTTDDAITLHARLRSLVDQGARRAAMEVSSHALDQGRVDALAFDVGVFTNLSRDHLDYHGSMERYAAAKKKLFGPGLRIAVVNADDPTGCAIGDAIRCQVETIAVGRRSAVRWSDVVFGSDGIRGVWITPWGRRTFSLPAFFGEFSVYNAACALAACCALGAAFDDVVDAMATLPGVPGRMQAVAASPAVVVDFAHTPDGLRAVLAAVRAHLAGSGESGGRVIAVFGCGGDRDRGKRALMARAAEAGSDLVVATSDNPRTEDPERILDDVVAGFRHPREALRIADRRDAIAAALGRAHAGDVVVLAGKGHEQYQEITGKRSPWSDAAVVRELLEKRGPQGTADRRAGSANGER